MTSTTAYRNPLLAATFRRLVPLEAVLITDELRRRPSRNPDYEGDARAEEALAQALSDSPKKILGALADIVLERLRPEPGE